MCDFERDGPRRPPAEEDYVVDSGRVWRHTFDGDTGEAHPFRPGYVNADCLET